MLDQGTSCLVRIEIGDVYGVEILPFGRPIDTHTYTYGGIKHQGHRR